VPGRSRSQLRKQQKMQQDWAEPDWRVRAKCFACDSDFVVNNYADRKVRTEKHTFQGVIICPWCWRRGGRKLAQANYLLTKLVEPESDSLGRIEKLQRATRKVLDSWR